MYQIRQVYELSLRKGISNMQNSNLLISTDDESLICAVEVVPNKCVTLFGRVNENPKYYSQAMQDLVKAIDPEQISHTDEDRDSFHPFGSPKKSGVKNFHHVHSMHDITETIARSNKWLPEDLKSFLLSYVN